VPLLGKTENKHRYNLMLYSCKSYENTVKQAVGKGRDRNMAWEMWLANEYPTEKVTFDQRPT
jgi:hypothetical protein